MNRLSPKKFLLWTGGLVLGTLLLIAAANYFLDPFRFRSSKLREVAATMQAGKNYAVYDSNVDFRGLRRQGVALMTTTPNVIVFSGSRFEFATADMFPGRTFYNSFIHKDYIEDLLALSDLLYKHNRLPKNLVLSVRYNTFLPIDPKLCDGAEFKNFWPEYKSMSKRLNLESESFYNVFPFAYWAQLFSVENIRRQIRFRTTAGVQGPVDAAVLDDMDVIHADGSVAFSRKHSASFTSTVASRGDKTVSATTSSGTMDAEQRAARDRKRPKWPLDPKRMDALDRLLAFLKEHGSSVSIAITPHHPAYWRGIQGSPYHASISAMEERVREISKANGGWVVGSLDPQRAGCDESSIRDFIHLDVACLKALFSQLTLKD